MAYNPGQPRGFGPHQPSITIPQSPYQQPPVAASPSGPTNNPCYNCGSIAHWAQHCPEPRRQVPAGSLIQRPRVPNVNKNPPPPKKVSKPVITRYAPPPGYQPPVGGAPPPPPPPPPQQAGPYQPQPYAAPVYGQQGSPVTPHQQWQSPQTYAAPAPQWQQQQQQPPVPAYGPHQPQAPQPYGGYGPHSPYPTATPTQQSPAQPYPPQPAYPVPHAQAHGQPHAQQHPQHVAPYPYPHMHQGHTPVQSPQTGYPPPHAQPPYPIITQYPQAVPHVAPYQPQQPHAPNPTFQPYVPPPQTNFRGHQQGGPSGGLHQRQHGNFARQNAHNHHHNSGDRSTHGGHKNERRPKKFQQPQQAEPPLPRPPSPPQFFPKAAPTSTKNKNGALAWKPAQPVDRPLEPINDGSKPKVSEEGADETSSTGSRYFDADGKAVKPEETQEMKDDPVWNSIKQKGTRLDMDGYEHAMDEDTEKLVTEMKTNLIAEEKLASRAQAPAKSGDASGNQKPGNNDGKNKRNWDEYIVTDKPSQDQDRRPNKRRHGNNRNQRGNRNNRHGNKQGGNRGGGHGGNAGASASGGPNGNAPAQSNQKGNNSAPQAPPAQRSFHPLPPKPVLGPAIQHSGDIRSANSSYPRPQGASARRSTSPDRGQQHELNYRQRDYSSRIKTEDGGVRIKSEDGVDAGHPKKIPENADVRRHGSAAMEAYSRRW